MHLTAFLAATLFGLVSCAEVCEEDSEETCALQVSRSSSQEGFCCQSLTATCLACKAGKSVEEFCKQMPGTDGCPGKVCCDALTASCEACKAGESVEEFCKRKPGTDGCPDKICCQSFNADCQACKTGESVEEFCKREPAFPGCPGACCRALTANCQACSAGVSVEEFCKQKPTTAGCPGKVCCDAVTASCEACKAGESVEEFCRQKPDFPGCPGKVCCRALTADCQACSAGVSVEEFCKQKPATAGCPGKVCCDALTASCEACKAGESVEEFCKQKPDTAGCPGKVCCDALTAGCEACKAGVSVEEFCKRNPETDGCHSHVVCSPPAEAFTLPSKSCPNAHSDHTTCLADNHNYAAFAEAWAACGQNPECGLITQWDGRFYLRRHSDPDIPGQGAGSMLYACSGHVCPATRPSVGGTCPSPDLDCDYDPVQCGDKTTFATKALCTKDGWSVVSAIIVCPTAPIKFCSPPAEDFALPVKSCPNSISDRSTCLAHNHNYGTFSEAWAACGENPECGLITQWTNGRYYLRRKSDPDLHPVEGAGSMIFACQ